MWCIFYSSLSLLKATVLAEGVRLGATAIIAATIKIFGHGEGDSFHGVGFHIVTLLPDQWPAIFSYFPQTSSGAPIEYGSQIILTDRRAFRSGLLADMSSVHQRACKSNGSNGANIYLTSASYGNYRVELQSS